MTRAVCPGSFDPVTHGHLDVIERTARVVDDVLVAVGTNISKNALFTPDERVEMLTEECAQWSNVEVTPFGDCWWISVQPTALASSAKACGPPISAMSCRWLR